MDVKYNVICSYCLLLLLVLFSACASAYNAYYHYSN